MTFIIVEIGFAATSVAGYQVELSLEPSRIVVLEVEPIEETSTSPDENPIVSTLQIVVALVTEAAATR
jgi:hypothetical protein